MPKKRTNSMPLSARVKKLVAALQREEKSIAVMVSMPTTGVRAKVRFEARAKILHQYIEGLQEASLVVEEDLKVAIIAVVALIHEDRLKLADTIHGMQQDLWATDEETPEEDKADKDYPQLWVPTAEHDMLQRLQKQIQDMLRAHEEGRQ